MFSPISKTCEGERRKRSSLARGSFSHVRVVHRPYRGRTRCYLAFVSLQLANPSEILGAVGHASVARLTVSDSFMLFIRHKACFEARQASSPLSLCGSHRHTRLSRHGSIISTVLHLTSVLIAILFLNQFYIIWKNSNIIKRIIIWAQYQTIYRLSTRQLRNPCRLPSWAEV